MQTYFLTTIVNRSMGEIIVEYFNSHGVTTTLSTMGRGTATNSILSILGLGEQEKEIIFSVMYEDKLKSIMRGLIHKMRLDIPGNGIAFTIPVSSVGGAKTLKYLAGDEPEGESMDKMNNNANFELIVAIVNRGYTEQVMDAARGAKAQGGTVIHAKGTGVEQAEKFFGVSLAVDKEMVFIVAETKNKVDIMKAIMSEAGINTKAKAVVFTLPIADIIGIRTQDDGMEE